MRLLTFLFIFALSFTAVFAQNKSDDSEATKQLYALFDSEWQQNLKDNPTFASTLGDKRYNDKWGDNSIAAFERRHKEDIATLAEINKIDRKQLSISDQLNYDLFKKDYEQNIESFKFKSYLLPINQRGGIQTQNNLANSLQFNDAKDYYDWLKRLKAFPEQMKQTIARMKEGKRLKIMWAKKVLERVPNQIDSQIVENPEDSPFYKPFTKFPDSISAAEQKEIISDAKLTIANVIIPEYKKLKQFFENEYLPAAYPNAGIWQHPQGEEYYSYLARSFTTTNMTPKEIHEKGLSEVKRIRAEMEKIKTKVGFKGDLKAFFDYLRTDEKFFYKTPEELLNGYRAVAKRIDPEVPKVIKTMPRMPYGVIPIPDQIAPDTTTAYYNRPAADGSRPGYYFVNLYKPETRPKWEMMALSIHEAVPGHHTQIALQQELGETPNFRKFGGYTAFTEGWGLYSESLGEDMGLYDDPYDKFGQLTYEMWRAVRLVVDIGMHYFKWDRQRAIDFFAENAPKTEQDIVNEIDRYISMPGQALAYKIGELKMQELRTKATRELGDKFDLREFHDIVLLSGAVPLDILERNVNEWIAMQKKQGVYKKWLTKSVYYGITPRNKTNHGSVFLEWAEKDVAYIITSEEKDAYLKLTTDEERETFIENFWRRRDSNPDTKANEFRDEHYKRIDYVNEHFTSGRPGWMTDRGLIYILYGKPDKIEKGQSDFENFKNVLFEKWNYENLDGICPNVEFTVFDLTGSDEFNLRKDNRAVLLKLSGKGQTTDYGVCPTSSF